MNQALQRLPALSLVLVALGGCTKEPETLKDRLVETGIRGDWASENHYVNIH